MALIQQVLEVCLYVDDIEQAEKFYTALFDWEIYSREGNRHVFFKIGQTMFLLFNPEETRKTGSVPSHGAIGAGHVAFTIEHEELDFWRNRLREQDVEIEHEMTWPSGGKSIYFRDPFHNSIEMATADVWP